jgi:hypothetical protein
VEDNVKNVPGVDVLVDSRYGARGHGKNWRQEDEAPELRDDPEKRNRRAALLRIQGPLKRAWEYPVFLDMFQANPRGYLEGEIFRMAVGTLPGNHADSAIIGALADTVTAALAETEGNKHPSIESHLDASAWSNGTDEEKRHLCAAKLLDALRETSHMLLPLTANECK